MSDKLDQDIVSTELNRSVEFNIAKRRKKRDLAALLPILGILLFATPIISTLNPSSENVSPTVLYIFGLWALLIIGSFFISRLMSSDKILVSGDKMLEQPEE